MRQRRLVKVRYLLGDIGRSLVVGIGHKPPRFAAVQSASCDPAPSVCNAAESKFSQDPNPEVATGSLIYGNYLLADIIEDSRSDASNMAAVRPCQHAVQYISVKRCLSSCSPVNATDWVK